MTLYVNGMPELPLGCKPATLDDLKAALAEYGMVAVPVEPTEAMLVAGGLAVDIWPKDARAVYEDMIQAAQEEGDAPKD